jgi:hypothetical protein
MGALAEEDDDQDAPLVSHTVEDLANGAILDHNLGRERVSAENVIHRLRPAL